MRIIQTGLGSWELLLDPEEIQYVVRDNTHLVPNTVILNNILEDTSTRTYMTHNICIIHFFNHTQKYVAEIANTLENAINKCKLTNLLQRKRDVLNNSEFMAFFNHMRKLHP